MAKTFTFEEFGFEVEIGKVAKQADGAVWFRQGGTVLLASVVSSPAREFPGFLPLTTDYREQFSAAGKIPGGYFKREGRPSDREVLTSRLIDRAIRPLFHPHFFDQMQVLITVYSVDKEHIPNTIALLAASMALSISKLPFLGPVGVVEVGRVNGEWVINPLYQDSLISDARIVIAGTEEGVCMIDGSMDEVPEKEFLDIMFKAHEVVKRLVQWQRDIQKELDISTKKEYKSPIDWSLWQLRVKEFLTEEHVSGLCVQDKVERNEHLTAVRDGFTELHSEAIEESGLTTKIINYIFDAEINERVTERIFSMQKRVDDRPYDKVRDISSEVGLLPFTHGSSLFTRGRTQALASVTLGGGQDEQRIDNIMSKDGEGETNAFMLHYNFPPFSVGEVFPMRGPGRREIGHGYLAASAIKPMLPSKDSFPYTIRIVADMLESDGSTSMATTCAATLALMHAGVPIKKMISGIAMGLLKNKAGDFVVLSDISGFEDAFGLMDFKVTGTDQGITAIQMDVKYKGGLTRDVFDKALAQAQTGRLHILNEMRKTMTQPNAEMSLLVPRVITVKVPSDKIGAIIGGGGRTIKEIIEVTKTQIDIEQDGLVKIFGGPDSFIDKAVRWVKTLGGQIEKDAIYEGKIRRIAEFGLFVELVPGLDGLVHVSNIPREKKQNFARLYKTDEVVKVRVLEYDASTGRVSLRIVEEGGE